MRTLAMVLLLASTSNAQVYTRGVGVYPGDPGEDFAPPLSVTSNTYRNLALHRAAYQSSSYDYNLTAQLLTDGIKEDQAPRWLSVVTSSQGELPRQERESVLDDNFATTVEFAGKNGWIQFEFGGTPRPEVDRVEADAVLRTPGFEPQEWAIFVECSEDGQTWKTSGMSEGRTLPPGEIHASVPMAAANASRFLRLRFDTGRDSQWVVSEVRFFRGPQRVRVGGPFDFRSAWMSAGRDKEWVYVDLGTRCTFDRVVLSWIAKPAQASLELSNDAKTWTVLRGVDSDELKLDKPATARYVRILMTGGPERYVLSEIEVWGRGGLAPQAKSQSAAGADGRLNLAAGAWRIERASLVNGDGVALSQAGFNDQDWIPATVPGTVLTSYFNVGAVPDPNFGDNIFAISDSFFYSDFWYRDEFVAPQVRSGRRLWLNFSGVNWKADVFLNGQKIGRIEGGFERGRFDVTQVIRPGEKNALAVRVEKNATPGTVREKTWDSPDKNGGALGADNPTYHASIGWDWIPTIRGRNTGIWGPVFLDQSGAATIDNPFVSSSLRPDGADVVIATTITNHGNQALMGVLKGRFGESKFQQAVSIDANSAKEVVLAPLHLQNPKLWWPAGYGDPNLYPVELEFVAADGAVSDVKRFESGVRQFRYAIENGALKMWINGRRFIPHGGNWGFSEAMLRYRGREYDAAMRYHADMHLNMVRNWVGQIGDDAFYDAADRHGIVVWQDFWLANPWDGPDPDDETMFMRNARDTILRIRNHPSIGLYCGRNEGYPPERLEQDFRKTLAELHPGIQYIPSSADEVVSGHGPYQAMPIDFYFRERATAKMHSELGMPNIMTMDSVRQTMPEDAIWPQGRMWGLHDFSLHGAQGGESFIQRIDRSYGGANSAADWIELAQFVNYNGYRAMYEAQSKNRMGLLIWMSHPTWPSFVWQTYDYFLEPTAGYFGTKKGSEPLHIQWNPLTDEVEVVNYSAGKVDGLTATAEIFNMDGGMKWNKSASVDSTEDSLQTPMKLEFPAGLSPVHFIRLRLTRDHDVVSDNFYWRATEQDNFSALRAMPKAKVRIGAASTEALGSVQRLTAELVNNSNVPALMVRVKVVREKSRDRILPAIYSDNYVALMPGEHRTVQVDITTRDTRGEAPELTLDGFNLEP